MLINGKEISVEEAVKLAGVEHHFLKKRNHGLLLSDYQVDVLNQNHIDYKNSPNIESLLFDIEEYLNQEENEELEEVSRQLSEIHYYNETHK